MPLFQTEFKPPFTELELPDGRKVKIGWTYLTTVSQLGKQRDIWMPVVGVKDLTPETYNQIRQNMVFSDNGSKLTGFDIQELELAPDDLDKVIVHSALLSDVSRFGIIPEDITANPNVKNIYSRYMSDFLKGNPPTDDFGQKLLSVKMRMPTEQQLGYGLASDAEIQKYNRETVENIANMRLDQVGGYLDQRQRGFGMVLGSKDIGQAVDYIRSLPFDTEQERQDTILTARQNFSRAHPVPGRPKSFPGSESGERAEQERAMARAREVPDWVREQQGARYAKTPESIAWTQRMADQGQLEEASQRQIAEWRAVVERAKTNAANRMRIQRQVPVY